VTGDIGRGVRDLGGMSDELHQVAADLQRAGERLRGATEAAAERSFEAVSTDGGVRVTASGARRITAVELAPEVLREDATTVATMLRIAMNEALRRARAGAREALLEDLPPQLRAPIEQGMADAEREVEEQS
jgi:DNA-binding protein YbaB